VDTWIERRCIKSDVVLNLQFPHHHRVLPTISPADLSVYLSPENA
jgi:hypothetical protein